MDGLGGMNVEVAEGEEGLPGLLGDDVDDIGFRPGI